MIDAEYRAPWARYQLYVQGAIRGQWWGPVAWEREVRSRARGSGARYMREGPV